MAAEGTYPVPASGGRCPDNATGKEILIVVRRPLRIAACGLVTSVGMNAPATCAAIRSKVANPTPTRFQEPGRTWMTACQVTLQQPLQGIRKLARMAALSIRECLSSLPGELWSKLPILVCVAERDRPGRLSDLDSSILGALEEELGVRFADQSAVIAHGRVGVAIAMDHAHKLLQRSGSLQVLIVATDSLLCGSTILAHQRAMRLRNARNSNGFMPGEASGALLVSLANDDEGVRCTGAGFGVEVARIDSDLPLRGDGLRQALGQALETAGIAIDQCPVRITDLSGEHYYFKEASLALARLHRGSVNDKADLWHPAECIGECGAAAGAVLIAVATAAFTKGYLATKHALLHMSNDNGTRAALVLKAPGST